MATNIQKYAANVAGVNRRQMYGFPNRELYEHSLVKMLNKYMILYGIENDLFTADEEIVMQNIFDSITAPD